VTRGFFLVLLAALLWSTGGLGIKLIPAETPALAIAGYRGLFALPVLLVPALLQLRGPAPATTGAADMADRLRAGLRLSPVWLGAASYAVTVIFFVIANRLTTAANTILLQYTAPIYVALLSYPLLREPVRRLDWLAIAGCIGGMAWFFTDQLSASGWLGNGAALFSGVGFGLLPVMMRLSLRRAPAMAGLLPLLIVVLGNVLTALLCLPWMILGLGTQAALSGSGWGVLVALGCLQIGLAYLLYTAGVRRLPAVQCLLVSTVEPLLNPVWVALGTGELPSRSALIGGALILLSVTGHGVLTGLQARRRRVTPPSPSL
jgi:drug/metabolite transporter (DMT)-like permease